MEQPTAPQAPAGGAAPSGQPPAPQKLTALEARQRYGTRSLILLVFLLWFGYDGWFNPKYKPPEKRGDMWFNRVGAYGLGLALVYHAIMFGSAALTVRRQGPTSAEPPPSPPTPPSS